MQRDSPKPAKVANPNRRLMLNRLSEAKNSARKNPNGTKTIRLEITSLRALSLPWSSRFSANPKLDPNLC